MELTGLSSAEAKLRLERDGPNELPRTRRRSPLRIARDVLREPMLAMLLGAGGIYLLLGDRTEGVTLLAFAGLTILITIVQEARTENVLDSLRALSAPRALVLRDGVANRIPGREVVVGDLVILEQGDRVPADALLLQAREIEVDESLLTGESVAVRKRAAQGDESLDVPPGGDDLPQVFSGCVVTRGTGIARVSFTGARSCIGRIGRSIESLVPEVPRLQRDTSRIVRLCTVGGLLLAASVVLLYGMMRGHWMEALLAGIAAAMSLLPEEFPVVLSVFLAMGAWRIARVGVLTRRAAAIETLGAATVLCSDKTGTLTKNRMTVASLWIPGAGHRELDPARGEEPYRSLLDAAMLASAPVPVDPMEVAFHDAARQGGPVHRGDRELVHTLGLRPDLLAMSNLWQVAGEERFEIAAKGAPEAIARLCRLEGAALGELLEAATSMAERGRRVLAVATAETSRLDRTHAQEQYDFRLRGLAGLVDPLRDGVVEAVEQCRSAGIRVVMITGDYPATAATIAGQAGLDAAGVMTGQELASLSDEMLGRRIDAVSVFARTLPEQKLRIVAMLKARGEIVAMTGDGVNDAPALKAAHIGIAMGRRGTDVAREASALLLVDDDFTAIVGAIRIGRRIYDNVRKAFSFIIAVHVPIAGLSLLPLALGLPVILGPLQIALLEMVIDPICALVFEAEREESRLMQRPPRDPQVHLISRPMLVRGVLQGALALLLVGGAFVVGAGYGLEAGRLRASAFFALLASILALVLANRSFSTSLGHALMRHNVTFRYVLAFIAAGSLVTLSVAPVRRTLQFSPLGLADLGLAALIGFAVLIGCEFLKRKEASGRRRP